MTPATQVPNLSFPPASCPVSAPINSVLLFTLGLACTTPLLSRAGSMPAPGEVFWGRKLLTVEPGNKVRCGYMMVGWGLGDSLVPRALPCMASWAGGWPSRQEFGAHTQYRQPLLETEQPLLPSQPFTRQEIIGFVIGSVSSVLYLFSRLPQIRINVSPEQGWAGPSGRGASLAAVPLG